MYQLYINKNTLELKVSKLKRGLATYSPVMMFERTATDDEIMDYNSNYKISKSRKALVQLAREIKALWLAEAHLAVQKIEEIKI